MPDTQYEVLFQFTLGLPMRQRPASASDNLGDLWTAFLKKWKDAGAEYVSWFTTPGYGLDGYSHRVLFRVKSADLFFKMSQAINESVDLFKYIEKYSLTLGSDSPNLHATWNSL